MAAFLTATPLTLSSCRASSTLSTTSLVGSRLTFQTQPPTRATFTPKMQLDMDEDELEAPASEPTKLFVGNLSWETTNESLEKAFAEHGTVIDARVVTDRFSHRSRGFGFIEYDEAGSAAEALEKMNGVEVDGRSVRVDRANPRTQNTKRRTEGSYY